MDKKGIIAEFQALFIASVTIVIILSLSVLIVEVLSNPEKEIKEISSKNPTASSLIAYLSTPVTVEVNGVNQNMSMADLIILAKINESYYLKFQEETNRIFDKVYGEGKYSLDTSLSELPLIGTDFPIAEKITLPLDIVITLRTG